MIRRVNKQEYAFPVSYHDVTGRPETEVSFGLPLSFSGTARECALVGSSPLKVRMPLRREE